MSGAIDQIDDITAKLREEGDRLRRRTLWLTLLPVVVGLAMLAVTWSRVKAARSEVATLEAEQTRLGTRIQEQQDAIEAMLVQRADLDREIADRQALLDQYAAKLPARERSEIANIQRGMEQVQAGDFSAAIQTYDKAIASDAGNPIPYRLRGSAYLAAGQNDEAIASLREALQRDPKDGEARYALGLALWAQGQRDEAAAEIERAFESPAVKARGLQDPAYSPIRGYMDSRAGQRSGSSEDEKAWIDKGLSAARKGDFAGAAEAYGKALAINPANWRVLNWQGYALLRNKDYEKAIASFERALKVDPGVAEIHYNLALTLWQSGRADDAKREIRRAFEVDPAYRAVAERDPQSRALRGALSR